MPCQFSADDHKQLSLHYAKAASFWLLFPTLEVSYLPPPLAFWCGLAYWISKTHTWKLSVRVYVAGVCKIKNISYVSYAWKAPTADLLYISCFIFLDVYSQFSEFVDFYSWEKNYLHSECFSNLCMLEKSDFKKSFLHTFLLLRQLQVSASFTFCSWLLVLVLTASHFFIRIKYILSLERLKSTNVLLKDP